MPVPSTGSLPNGEAFLSAFGEPIILDDASVITGVFKAYNALDEVGSYQAARRYAYRLWVPRNKLGTLGLQERVTARGETFWVSAVQEDADYWNAYTLVKEN